MSTVVISEPIAQLQLQLEQIRSTQPPGKRLPDSVWQAAVELAREHRVYSVAHHLRLDYTGLKKRLGGVSHRRRKARKPAFVELIAPTSEMLGECSIEFESLRGGKVRIQWKAAQVDFRYSPEFFGEVWSIGASLASLRWQGHAGEPSAAAISSSRR